MCGFGFVSLGVDSYCNQVKVVAHVVLVQKHTTNHVYVMNDGMGTVEVWYWPDSDFEASHAIEEEAKLWRDVGEEPSENNEQIWSVTFVRFPSLYFLHLQCEHNNASITGHIKMIGSRKYMHTVNIQPVKDPHEIFFHLAEVIAIEVTPKKKANVEASLFSLDQPMQHPQIPLKGETSELPTLPQKILHFMEKQPEQPDGLDVTKIAKAIEGNANSIE